jgi:hypothetical protein
MNEVGTIGTDKQTRQQEAKRKNLSQPTAAICACLLFEVRDEEQIEKEKAHTQKSEGLPFALLFMLSTEL